MISTQGFSEQQLNNIQKHLHPKGPGGGGDALRLTDPATFIMAKMSGYVLVAYVCGIIIRAAPLSSCFSACFRGIHVERSLPRLT